MQYDLVMLGLNLIFSHHSRMKNLIKESLLARQEYHMLLAAAKEIEDSLAWVQFRHPAKAQDTALKDRINLIGILYVIWVLLILV